MFLPVELFYILWCSQVISQSMCICADARLRVCDVSAWVGVQCICMCASTYVCACWRLVGGTVVRIWVFHWKTWYLFYGHRLSFGVLQVIDDSLNVIPWMKEKLRFCVSQQIFKKIHLYWDSWLEYLEEEFTIKLHLFVVPQLWLDFPCFILKWILTLCYPFLVFQLLPDLQQLFLMNAGNGRSGCAHRVLQSCQPGPCTPGHGRGQCFYISILWHFSSSVVGALLLPMK